MKLPARLVTASALALMAAGCSAVNPITTQQAYDASDGMSVEVGDVRGLNLLVVTEAEGSPAVLLGAFTNPTDETVTVVVSLGDADGAPVEVPAGATVVLGGQDAETSVTGTAPAAPGRIASVTLATDGTGAVEALVPVVDGTLPEYQEELAGLG